MLLVLPLLLPLLLLLVSLAGSPGVQRADHGSAQRFFEAPQDQRGPRQGRRGRRRACRDGGSGSCHVISCRSGVYNRVAISVSCAACYIVVAAVSSAVPPFFPPRTRGRFVQAQKEQTNLLTVGALLYQRPWGREERSIILLPLLWRHPRTAVLGFGGYAETGTVA